jgi:hypothetical protein
MKSKAVFSISAIILAISLFISITLIGLYTYRTRRPQHIAMRCGEVPASFSVVADLIRNQPRRRHCGSFFVIADMIRNRL